MLFVAHLRNGNVKKALSFLGDFALAVLDVGSFHDESSLTGVWGTPVGTGDKASQKPRFRGVH
jgi:hypothetical protein